MFAFFPLTAINLKIKNTIERWLLSLRIQIMSLATTVFIFFCDVSRKIDSPYFIGSHKKS